MNISETENADRIINLKVEYDRLLKSGMMWEFHPELTGNWEEDKFIFASKFNK